MLHSEHRAARCSAPLIRFPPGTTLLAGCIHGWPHPFAKNARLAHKEQGKTSQGLSPLIIGGQPQSEGCLWPVPAGGEVREGDGGCREDEEDEGLCCCALRALPFSS